MAGLPTRLEIPRGRLRSSRVRPDPGAGLAVALERELTGYALFEPQDALLLDAETRGVLTFESGVPVLAYEAGSDTGGPEALAALSVPGPYSVDLFELPADALARAHETESLRVPPGMPADRLAGDAALAERTAAAAPPDWVEPAPTADPVEAFLADEAKIAAIREEARAEARARAAEWGLDGHLSDEQADGSTPTVESDSDGE